MRLSVNLSFSFNDYYHSEFRLLCNLRLAASWNGDNEDNDRRGF